MNNFEDCKERVVRHIASYMLKRVASSGSGGGYKSLIINNLAIICAGFTRSAVCFGLPLFER